MAAAAAAVPPSFPDPRLSFPNFAYLLPFSHSERYSNISIYIDNSGNSFGSTGAVFLTSASEIWINLIVWTIISTAAVFGAAAMLGARSNADKKTHYWAIIVLVISALLFGGFIGFLQGCLSAALIAAISVSIPYPVGLDIAAGLGIGQAIVIVYFHLGRADFIHR